MMSNGRDRGQSIDEIMERMREDMYSVVDKYVEELRERALSSLPTTTDVREKRLKELKVKTPESPSEKSQKVLDIVERYNIGDRFTTSEFSDKFFAQYGSISGLLPVLSSHKNEFGLEYDSQTKLWTKVRKYQKPKMMSEDLDSDRKVLFAISEYPVGAVFSVDELSEATGYGTKSIRAYLRRPKERMEILGIKEEGDRYAKVN
ncbi:MAG: hypothetical protein HYW24_02330 [Candidatus Aenigmarchaeota archaeon]|nr:hypothetical protein [Candidatus Aenigmarchaeota archaeon]